MRRPAFNGLTRDPGYKSSASIVVALILLFLATGLSHAEVPYRNYVFDFWGVAEPAPQAYVPVRHIGGAELGIGVFRDPVDLFVGPDRSVYVVDTGNNRIVCLDDGLSIVRVISEFDNGGRVDRFNKPSGVHVTKDGTMYVADTANARVVRLSLDGSFIDQIGPPVSNVPGVIPEGFLYQPIRLGVDPRGSLYVVSRNTFDGFVNFDNDGQFKGFIGAPRVTPSAADLFWSKVATREQRERQALFLPIEYASIDVDDRGFIYAVEAGPAKDQSIKRLNPSGVDILKREGFHKPVGEVLADPSVEKSSFVDIASREMGMYSVLDATRGRVYTYDSMGSLMYVFGNLGQQLGTFVTPCAVDSIGQYMLVLDRRTGLLTLFEPTEYAKSIHMAMALYESGRYDESAAMWEKVLEMNANCDFAYIGIGRNLLRRHELEGAMAYLRLGNDRADFSDAFQAHRREMVEQWFPYLATAAIILSALAYLLRFVGIGEYVRSLLMKRQSRLLQRLWHPESTLRKTYESLRYSLFLVVHPFDGFWGLKHEKKGNVTAATCLLGMVAVTYIIVRQYTGFIHNERDLTRLNIYLELASVLVPFGLWCTVNWALTTLMDGKGRIVDIYITTAYALTPLILVNIPGTALSHFVIVEEAVFLHLLVVFGVIWAVWLLFVGTMTVHEYDAAKMTMTSILTVAGMGFCIFIAMLFFSLLNKLVVTAMEVYTEISFRM